MSISGKSASLFMLLACECAVFAEILRLCRFSSRRRLPAGVFAPAFPLPRCFGRAVCALCSGLAFACPCPEPPVTAGRRGPLHRGSAGGLEDRQRSSGPQRVALQTIPLPDLLGGNSEIIGHRQNRVAFAHGVVRRDACRSSGLALRLPASVPDGCLGRGDRNNQLAVLGQFSPSRLLASAMAVAVV